MRNTYQQGPPPTSLLSMSNRLEGRELPNSYTFLTMKVQRSVPLSLTQGSSLPETVWLRVDLGDCPTYGSTFT